MADWYVSSANYAAVPAWAASTAYTVGQFIKPVTVPANTAYVYRCTTAGTSGGTEPASWSTANNSTTASGTAVFTNVTGQSAYGWSAAAGTLYAIAVAIGNRLASSDRVFIGSDHSETNLASNPVYAFASQNYTLVQIISVNRAGSVPPVAADLQNGAAITASSGNFLLEALTNIFYQGVTFTNSGTGNITFNNTGARGSYFKNCAFKFTNAGASTAKLNVLNSPRITWDNTTVQFSNAGQFIGGLTGGNHMELHWINTPSAIQGSTFPTSLFSTAAGGAILLVTCRGVDLSAVTGTLLAGSAQSWQGKVLLDDCRIASGLTRWSGGTVSAGVVEEVELINCYDGTNFLNERYTAAGTVTTDRSTTLSGGAQDDVGAYSLKLVSSTRSDFQTFTLDAFAFDVENSATGASKTATVEIISSASLNNIDIRLVLEYMGTAGSSIASFVESLAAILTASSPLPSSSVTWNNPPSTPQKQYLQVTFTPQTAGRVRGLVRLGKASTTVWVNPQITIA